MSDEWTTRSVPLITHHSLLISSSEAARCTRFSTTCSCCPFPSRKKSSARFSSTRSEEHTSELQSQSNLVCRLLLENKHNANALNSRDTGNSALHRYLIAIEVRLSEGASKADVFRRSPCVTVASARAARVRPPARPP